MNKKFAFVFLGLGLLLLALYIVFIHTDIFKKNTPPQPEVKHETIYDYVKSNDIYEKTKITFLVPDNMSLVEYSSNEFSKTYINSSNTKLLTASIYSDNEDIDTIVERQFVNFREPYVENDKQVENESISCNYVCKKYKVLNSDHTLHAEELLIYYKVNDNEIFNLTYHSEKEELSKEEIDNIINLKITNDATYLIGHSNDTNLVIDFKLYNNKILEIVLDNKKFEEVMKGTNSDKSTTIKDLDKNIDVILMINYQRKNKPLLEDIDKFYDSYLDKKEITLNGKKFYEYNFEDKKSYAYIVDDTALLIESNDGLFDINDFVNIKVKDAN